MAKKTETTKAGGLSNRQALLMGLSITAIAASLVSLILAVWVKVDTSGPKYKNSVGAILNSTSMGWVHEEYLLEGKDSITIESEATLQLVNNTNATVTLYGFAFDWKINGSTVGLKPSYYFLNRDNGNENAITEETVYTLNPGNVLNINFRLYWEPGKDSSGYEKTVYTDLNKIITDNNIATKKNGTDDQKKEAVDTLFKQLDDYLDGIDTLQLDMSYKINTGAGETSYTFDAKPKWNHNDSYKEKTIAALTEDSSET